MAASKRVVWFSLLVSCVAAVCPEFFAIFGASKIQVTPISQFPRFHPKVNQGVCGSVSAGSPIPAGTSSCTDCLWSTTGETNATQCVQTDQCIQTPLSVSCDGNGAVLAPTLFHAKDFPQLGGNTGYFAAANSVVVWLLEDAAKNHWLLFEHNFVSAASSVFSSVNMIHDLGAQIVMVDPFVSQGPICTAVSDSPYYFQDIASGAFCWNFTSTGSTMQGIAIGPLTNDWWRMSASFTLDGLGSVSVTTGLDTNSDVQTVNVTENWFTILKTPSSDFDGFAQPPLSCGDNVFNLTSAVVSSDSTQPNRTVEAIRDQVTDFSAQLGPFQWLSEPDGQPHYIQVDFPATVSVDINAYSLISLQGGTQYPLTDWDLYGRTSLEKDFVLLTTVSSASTATIYDPAFTTFRVKSLRWVFPGRASPHDVAELTISGCVNAEPAYCSISSTPSPSASSTATRSVSSTSTPSASASPTPSASSSSTPGVSSTASSSASSSSTPSVSSSSTPSVSSSSSPSESPTASPSNFASPSTSMSTTPSPSPTTSLVSSASASIGSSTSATASVSLVSSASPTPSSSPAPPSPSSTSSSPSSSPSTTTMLLTLHPLTQSTDTNPQPGVVSLLVTSSFSVSACCGPNPLNISLSLVLANVHTAQRWTLDPNVSAPLTSSGGSVVFEVVDFALPSWTNSSSDFVFVVECDSPSSLRTVSPVLLVRDYSVPSQKKDTSFSLWVSQDVDPREGFVSVEAQFDGDSVLEWIAAQQQSQQSQQSAVTTCLVAFVAVSPATLFSQQGLQSNGTAQRCIRLTDANVQDVMQIVWFVSTRDVRSGTNHFELKASTEVSTHASGAAQYAVLLVGNQGFACGDASEGVQIVDFVGFEQVVATAVAAAAVGVTTLTAVGTTASASTTTAAGTTTATSTATSTNAAASGGASTNTAASTSVNTLILVSTLQAFSSTSKLSLNTVPPMQYQFAASFHWSTGDTGLFNAMFPSPSPLPSPTLIPPPTTTSKIESFAKTGSENLNDEFMITTNATTTTASSESVKDTRPPSQILHEVCLFFGICLCVCILLLVTNRWVHAARKYISDNAHNETTKGGLKGNVLRRLRKVVGDNGLFPRMVWTLAVLSHYGLTGASIGVLTSSSSLRSADAIVAAVVLGVICVPLPLFATAVYFVARKEASFNAFQLAQEQRHNTNSHSSSGQLFLRTTHLVAPAMQGHTKIGKEWFMVVVVWRRFLHAIVLGVLDKVAVWQCYAVVVLFCGCLCVNWATLPFSGGYKSFSFVVENLGTLSLVYICMVSIVTHHMHTVPTRSISLSLVAVQSLTLAVMVVLGLFPLFRAIFCAINKSSPSNHAPPNAEPTVFMSQSSYSSHGGDNDDDNSSQADSSVPYGAKTVPCASPRAPANILNTSPTSQRMSKSKSVPNVWVLERQHSIERRRVKLGQVRKQSLPQFATHTEEQ